MVGKFLTQGKRLQVMSKKRFPVQETINNEETVCIYLSIHSSSTQFCFNCFKGINSMPRDPADHLLSSSRDKEICDILKYPMQFLSHTGSKILLVVTAVNCLLQF